MTTALPEYYTWTQVPAHHRTKKQWLKKHRRLKKGARAVGTITLVFDKPRGRPKNVPPVSPEECERIRKKLMRLGSDSSDLSDLHRLDRAGQLAVINLYAVEDTEEITAFAEPEARKLLEYMVWDGSHADHYITEATTNGHRERATWKTEVSTPSLRDHLAGERYFGTKRGDSTMQVTVDCDRHSGKISGEDHVQYVLKVGEVLAAEFSAYRFAPEINATNGSVKFFGWLPDFTATASAAQQAERVRGVLPNLDPSTLATRASPYSTCRSDCGLVAQPPPFFGTRF